MTTPDENPTDFYDSLAPLFDVMTDWDARLAAEWPFLAAVLQEHGATTVLDAACGSGGHTLALADHGYRAAGADVSPVMIQMARQKALAAGLDIPFAVSDLAGLPDVPGFGAYDAVLCLGNSLPHLLTEADLGAALRGVAALLRPGGIFVTQNLNYDLRWQQQPRWFAAQGGRLDREEVLVWRFADYDAPAGRIAFHIALFRRAARGWQVEVHTTPQRPWFQAELLAALQGAGFAEIASYGRMVLPPEPFDAVTSGDLVIVARKTE
jgi:glycine/sarcosine N-methyltransferase